MQCRLCSYEFCWICLTPASYEHFLPFSFFGCGADLYQTEYTGLLYRLGYKIIKYILVMLTLICIAIAFAPCVFARQLYDEDRSFNKRHPKASLCLGMKTKN